MTENVPTSLSSGSSEPRPYLPIVNAIAPNAPMGATRVISVTMRKKTAENWLITPSSGAPLGPACDSAVPNSSATSSTCRISPLEKASTSVVGMMCSRNSTVLWPCACVA